MRRFVSIIALALGIGLAASAGEPPAVPSSVHATQISQLITLLGSQQFKEREAATKSLDALGLIVMQELQKARQGNNPEFRASAEKLADAFMEGLRQASQNNDLEVRRRAEVLAQQAQRRLDAVQLLEPTRVRILCKDAPLSEAVSQFAKDRSGKPTGISVQFAQPYGRTLARTSSPRITLDTGETTFWEAFDQFCQRAGLIEAPIVANNEQVVRVWNGNGAARVQAVVIANPYQGSLGTNDGRINLIEGKPPVLPSCYTGPVRFRAVSTHASAWSKGKDETVFVLEVTPQPKLAWQGVVDLHIDKAIDEHGQSLAPAIGTEGAGTTVAGANGAIVWESDLSSAFDPRQVPVRLKSADRPSKVLKEVRGSIAAQMETPSQPLVTVEHILSSTGKTVRGAGGEALKVIEVKQESNGSVKLRLQIDAPLQEMLGKFNGRVVIRGNAAVAKRGFIVPGGGMIREPINPAAQLRLVDGKGQGFEIVGAEYDMSANANGVNQEMQLSYRPTAGQGEAAKLIYSGRRTVVIDVPFTLKDVPLP